MRRRRRREAVEDDKLSFFTSPDVGKGQLKVPLRYTHFAASSQDVWQAGCVGGRVLRSLEVLLRLVRKPLVALGVVELEIENDVLHLVLGEPKFAQALDGAVMHREVDGDGGLCHAAAPQRAVRIAIKAYEVADRDVGTRGVQY
jgi:hypothetical protein